MSTGLNIMKYHSSRQRNRLYFHLHRSNFFWHAPWFWVLCDNGDYTQAVGEHSRGSLNRSLSHSQQHANGKWSSVEAVLYFAVSEDVKAFTLIYVSNPVAEGIIE
jgi:hypothetical protein